MKYLPIIASMLILCSCSADKEKATVTAAANPPEQKPIETFNMTQAQMENPTNPVVSVDGEILRNGDLNTEIAVRLSNLGQQAQNPELASQMRGVVIEQYITRTLLLNDAKKREITASEDDLKAELDAISKMIPPGVTVEDMLNQSPLGKDTMLQHIKNKIIIDKLTAATIKDKINIADKDVDDFITEHKADLTIPETVEARHILIQFSENDDDKAKEAKKEALKKIRQEIIDGADFAEVAKQKSDCPSKENGGLLGKFSKGRMVPEFEQAAFSQKVGEVGEIVTTQFGHHIIKVDSHEQESLYPREEIIEKIRELETQTVMMDYLKELRSKADIKTF